MFRNLNNKTSNYMKIFEGPLKILKLYCNMIKSFPTNYTNFGRKSEGSGVFTKVF